MKIVAAFSGVVLVLIFLWDAFETIILPRRVTRKYRLTRFFIGIHGFSGSRQGVYFCHSYVKKPIWPSVVPCQSYFFLVYGRSGLSSGSPCCYWQRGLQLMPPGKLGRNSRGLKKTLGQEKGMDCIFPNVGKSIGGKERAGEALPLFIYYRLILRTIHSPFRY